MTSKRAILKDALFMLIYIGLIGAMLCLTLVLGISYLLDIKLALPLWQAAALNLAGWSMLPALERIYRPLTGTSFAWRSNAVLGG
jgi:hypothetical protein